MIDAQNIKSIFTNENEKLTIEIRSAAADHNKEFFWAREKLISAGLQINTLFLTGWIALLSVGKLGHEITWLPTAILATCCLLHCGVFALIMITQWNVMKLHFNSQRHMSSFQKIVNAMTQEKIKSVESHAEHQDATRLLKEIEESAKPFNQFADEYSQEYKRQNNFAWCIGKWAISFFFISMLSSLTAFTFLLRP